MTESILLSLISTLSSVLFNGIMQEPKYLELEGAPDWYGKYTNDKYIVAYGYSDSNRDFLKSAKDDCKNNMISEIEILLNKTLSKNKENLNEEFNLLKTKYLSNQNYEYYFNKELNYKNIYHEYEKNQTFSKCIIDKNSFLTYQKEILEEFNKNYNISKMNEKQKELEREIRKL